MAAGVADTCGGGGGACGAGDQGAARRPARHVGGAGDAPETATGGEAAPAPPTTDQTV